MIIDCIFWAVIPGLLAALVYDICKPPIYEELHEAQVPHLTVYDAATGREIASFDLPDECEFAICLHAHDTNQNNRSGYR